MTERPTRTFWCQILVAFLMVYGVLGMSGGPLHAQDNSNVEIGGAVRFNLLLTSYENDGIAVNDGQFTWDAWWIDVSAQHDAGVTLEFQYRLYPTFGTHFIHHGYVGYGFDEQNEIQIGVMQVPFGDQTYASHSWWFSNAYYMGLEDDYDMGLKYVRDTEKWDFALAYYFSPEPAGPSPSGIEEFPSYGIGGSGRYSYDIIPKAPVFLEDGTTAEVGASNQERNQFNGRAAYSFSLGDLGMSEIGFSGQYGQIYNSSLDEFGSHSAIGAHLDLHLNRFNVKPYVIFYDHDALNDDGTDADLVHMGAYGSGTYPVAAQATLYNLGVSYSLPVGIGPISNLTFYNDYTFTDKTKDGFEDTQQDILGFMVTAGNIFTYCDIAMGKNHPWLTDSFGTGLGQGVEGAGWNTRFNINIGYYF